MNATAPTFRSPHPDQLNLMVRVASPTGWLVLAVFLLTVLGALIWAMLATAPLKVSGSGVLQGSGGVLVVVSPATAPIAELKVGVGNTVTAGEIVLTLSDPVLDARAATVGARLAGLLEDQAKLLAFQVREREVRARADAQRREDLERTAQLAKDRETTLGQLLASQRDLLSRGLATRDRILLTENEREQARRDASDAVNAVNALTVDADERSVKAEREQLDLEARIAQTRQELAEVNAERVARTVVRAPVAGRVIELAVSASDTVAAGSPLMRLVPQDAGGELQDVQAILFVPPADGKRVQPGMAVQIVPSTARVERDGFIRGEVVHVSETPATREAVQQIIRNAAFVDTLMASGPPFEVRVALKRHPATVSGFDWSSELGGQRTVESGTVIKGSVVVERRRILSLVLPAYDNVLHALGIDP